MAPLIFFPDGPILVHTTFGDLLRSLDSPASLRAPLNLALSREGFVVAHFPGGHVASFTANGNLLRHEIHNDKIQGRTDGPMAKRDRAYCITYCIIPTRSMQTLQSSPFIVTKD